MLATHTHTLKTFVSFCVMLVLCYVFMKIYELVARSRHVVACGRAEQRRDAYRRNVNFQHLKV